MVVEPSFPTVNNIPCSCRKDADFNLHTRKYHTLIFYGIHIVGSLSVSMVVLG